MRQASLIVLVAGFVVISPAFAPAQAPKKLPPPPEKAVADATRQIAEVYKKDMQAAKSPPQKRALAKKLLSDAEGTRNDPTTKFALLSQVRKTAVQSGDVDIAISAVEAIYTEFAVNHSTLALDVLKDVMKNIKTPEQFFLALRWVEYSLTVPNEIDRFASSQKLAEYGLLAAKATKDRELNDEWIRRLKEIKAEAEAYTALAKPLRVLETDQTNAAASLQVGKFLAFTQHDWKRGLAILAQGDDEYLAALAKHDVTNPADGAERKTLGDGWYNWANSQEGATKSGALTRAAHWYRLALPELSGLERTRLANRVAEGDALTSPFREGRWVELLDRVDVGRHRVSGSWQRNGVAVECPATQQSHLLTLPVEVEGSYEIRLRATNLSREFILYCPHPKNPFAVAINCWDGTKSGIHLIDGATAESNPSSVDPFKFAPEQLNMLLVHVERADGLVAIETQVNGRKYAAWRGREASLSSPNTKNPQRMMINSIGTPLTLFSVQLRVLRGSARFTE